MSATTSSTDLLGGGLPCAIRLANSSARRCESGTLPLRTCIADLPNVALGPSDPLGVGAVRFPLSVIANDNDREVVTLLDADGSQLNPLTVRLLNFDDLAGCDLHAYTLRTANLSRKA